MMGDTQAEQLHRRCCVVDLHADTPMLMTVGYDLAAVHEPPIPKSAYFFHVDLPRARHGGLNAQFFGLVSPPWRRLRPATVIGWQLNALERAEAAHPDQLALVTTAAAAREAVREGKLAGLRGIEGAHALEGQLDRLEHFVGRGVVYLGLLHFHRNDAGAPAHGRGMDDSLGLTPFGNDLVDELNRLGVMVDLTHINRKGFLEAARRSRTPVIVSHTTILGAHNHWRGIDDEQIRAVAHGGGCIGVMFAREYLGGGSIDQVCAHLEHLLKVGGESTPALGSDFDGFIRPPDGLTDVASLPRLTDALLRRGLPEAQLSKILGENALRVLEEVCG
jgi:membrane dipeptidase